MKEKFFTKDLVFWLLVIVYIVFGILFIPKSGKFVLLEEFFDISIILGAIVYFIIIIFKNKNSIIYTKKWVGIIIIFALIFTGGYFTRNIILDLFSDTEKVELYNVDVSKIKKKIIIHYYLSGNDINGNRYRFEIDDDDIIKIDDNVIIEYYKYTDRVISIK